MDKINHIASYIGNKFYPILTTWQRCQFIAIKRKNEEKIMYYLCIDKTYLHLHIDEGLYFYNCGV
jgi:hypothetical protein